MAEYSQQWMQLHNATLGNLPLKHITLPSSHDAGTSYVHNNLRTELGLDDMVLTQTRSILDQLNLGVRYLDIRPVLTSKSSTQDAPSWHCGHYTNVGDAVGVQGASCVPIQKVVDDINTFTRKNPELVVIHIKRTQRIHISPATSSDPLGGKSTEREPTQREWEDFFGLLKRLENLHTVESPGASKHTYLHDLPLKYFIGNGKPAGINNTVVVYGGKRITNQTVLDAVQKAIEHGKPFHVSDESLGGVKDNRKGKSAAVLYHHQGLLKARWAPESQALRFDTDITGAYCENHDVMSQPLYNDLLPKIFSGRKWKLSKDFLSPKGKALGLCKSIHIRLRVADGKLEEVKAKKGEIVDFAKFGPSNI
ncbi:hypothetical protein GCG54_00002978 [Colletotrichum gloeosporioides]|uniref:Phosphatidylinositol-specific phospholipase C n=1 Tax=Colletotrichum gloeosporioides TaxID=474922 RepID=A0A8H4FQM9_COLGL|nr:uncharacterized protein GCG54_00002978 [Colletotrichum gloeosporioides]KAF3810801.1 hypothetical protein GCG54_00002978 [Colletotrichum gloeosporioides]